ncbi:MAG: hypothetical protein N4A47_04180 [Clostridia bacterium]|jgi:hypothetical protein|nr:hypothetical protein [Clostridia bacterium]
MEISEREKNIRIIIMIILFLLVMALRVSQKYNLFSSIEDNQEYSNQSIVTLDTILKTEWTDVEGDNNILFFDTDNKLMLVGKKESDISTTYSYDKFYYDKTNNKFILHCYEINDNIISEEIDPGDFSREVDENYRMIFKNNNLIISVKDEDGNLNVSKWKKNNDK